MRTIRWLFLVLAVSVCACRFSANSSQPDTSSDNSETNSQTSPELLMGTMMPGLTKNTLSPPEEIEPTDIIVPTGELPPIVFTAHGWCINGSGDEIFLINPDGSGLICLTRTRGDDKDPAWSPDGTRIVFISNRTGSSQAFVMDANGENQTQITNAPNGIEHPEWTADGIVYSYKEERGSSIHRINLDGSNDQVILSSEDGCANSYPNVSRDGLWITFSRFGGEAQAGIWVMRIDGSDLRLVVSGPLHFPAWSPDGTQIAFDGEPHGCKFDIYVINADGTDMRQLTDHPDRCGAYNKKPVWSPDGRQIMFASQLKLENTEAFELFIMNADGSNSHQVTHLDGDYSYYASSYNADWNPAAGE